ncbi:MAG: DUF2721 domain-containing protein [Desulfobulbaceae bacterium]|nr:DUF2721 domain-containing protein [Desulfobulbaceae bacterium]
MDVSVGASQIQSNPFVILTFIVAPAILTNASAMMVMSTSNRFARAIDRARDLSRQLEVAREDNNLTLLDRLNSELLLTERRAVLLLTAIRSFYFSLGGFAFAALFALVGAELANMSVSVINRICAILAIVAVLLAVGGLVIGSVLLVSETRITVGIIQDRIRKINQNRQ